MPKFDADAIARFEEVLRKDPKSQVFAPLAEAYREAGRLPEAERMAASGTKRFPSFPGGWITYAKILRELKKPEAALPALQRAMNLAPENILALQLLGETYLDLKNPKEALKVFKRILFLNPLAEKAKRIVQKLESLTADEYDEELFSMTKLSPLQGQIPPAPAPLVASPKPGEPPKGMVRMLSLIDAFIVRNDIHRADQLLDETRVEFGEHAEIQQRALLLQRRRASQLANERDLPENLAPIASREKGVREKKIQTLRMMLREIERYRESMLIL